MPDPTRVTVTTEPCSCGSVHASFAHHRDFPETRAEGYSPKAAASRLVSQLTVSLDHAPSEWRRAQIRQAIQDASAFATQCTEGAVGAAPVRIRCCSRLRSMLVGLDGSPHSVSAVRLGIAWAKQADALLVGLAIVDQPTIAAQEPVLLGGVPYADPVFYRERMADAHRQATGFLGQFSLQCAEAGVASKVLEDVGLPADEIALEAQRYDLVLIGQKTQFHFETQERRDETLARVLRTSPRPVVVVPDVLGEGQPIVVAYDGSAPAARALFAFESSGLGRNCPVHVVSVHAEHKIAARNAERAVDFLALHEVRAVAHAVASDAAPAGIILDTVGKLRAGLVVMGPYGRPALLEFFLGSTTQAILREGAVPVFLFH